MRSLKKTIKIRNFSGGMASNYDPADLIQKAGIYVNNADVGRQRGRLCKTYGTADFDFNGAWPPEGGDPPDVYSIGRMVYTKVWDNDVKVNTLKELIVLQLDCGENSLYWYELERTVGDDDWVLSGPFACGWDDNFVPYQPYWTTGVDGQWGVTKAGKIRWHEKDGVLRAACGAYIETDENHPEFNKSDSYPFQWRYINRYPGNPDIAKVNGYFQNYDDFDTSSSHPVGHCQWHHAGFWRGRSIPDYTPSLSVVLNSAEHDIWQVHDKIGYQTSARLLYALLAEYDGHQIAPLKMEPLEKHDHYHSDNTHTWTCKFKISIPKDDADDYEIPTRLTGYRFIASMIDMGIIGSGGGILGDVGYDYPPYVERARIDIKDGIEKVFGGEGYVRHDGATNTLLDFSIGTDQWAFEALTSTGDHTNFWKDFFVKIQIDADTYEEYKIDSSVGVNQTPGLPDAYRIRLAFNRLPTAQGGQLADETWYKFEINSRWYAETSGSDEYASIVFFDNGQTANETPSWVDVGSKVEDQPIVTCNPTQFIDYTERMFAVPDVALDDEIESLVLPYSNPVNDPFAGFDLFPNYIEVPTTKDDKIMGVGNHLDFLIIWTKYKIFRYLISGTGIYLDELPWDVGLVSRDSLTFDGDIWRFLGRKRDKISWYAYDGENEPREIGEPIQDELSKILSAQHIEPDLAQSFNLPKEDKVLLSIPKALILEPVDNA